MNLYDPRRRGTLMAPFNHLHDALLIALEDCLDAPVPAVSNPPLHSQAEGRLLGVMPEENTLDPSFDRHVRPCLLHMDRNYHGTLVKATMKSVSNKERARGLENAEGDRLEFVLIPLTMDGFTE
jgi:hypothetical protein